MIFESTIREMTQPKIEFEFPTEMDILKEYYENEITLLNYIVEYKNALVNVDESTDLAVIQEEFNNKAINKIKEIIKKFIEFCKKILKAVKDKIKEYTTSINHKLQTIDYYIKYKKIDNIIVKQISGNFVVSFDDEASEYGKKLEQGVDALKDAANRDDIKEYDIKGVYDIIKNMNLDSPDPNKFIRTVVIEKKNAAKVLGEMRDNMQIAQRIGVNFDVNIKRLIANVERFKDIANTETAKDQQILSAMNLIITKSQMLANTHASVIKGFLDMTNSSLEQIIKKAKVKEDVKGE